MWTTVRRRSWPHNKSLLRLRDPSRTLTGACDDMAHLPARSHREKKTRHVLFVNHQITINNMHTAHKFIQLTDVSRVHNDLLLSLLSIVYSTYITCIFVNPLWESYLLVNNGIPWHSQFMDLWWSPKLIINEPSCINYIHHYPPVSPYTLMVKTCENPMKWRTNHQPTGDFVHTPEPSAARSPGYQCRHPPGRWETRDGLIKW